ncbi:MAG TPA: MYXO-CTERM sorting domain-containing protein, partial [Polyangiaceae bacterium]|nr:MYXO-CTERM sorting domain-containing protein [Polyangiaceae bacterium]
FRFKNDRLVVIGSEAVPFVHIDASGAGPDDAALEKTAMAWVAADYGDASVSAISDAFILPVRSEAGRLELHVVRAVTVTPAHVTARFEVYVDVSSGHAVARRQMLRFAEANVALHVPERSPSYGPRMDAPLTLAAITVDGSASKSTAAGLVTWTTATSSAVSLSLIGDRARVFNDSGPAATLDVTLDDLSPYVWDASTDAPVDAQLATFVHAGEIREHAKTFAPTLGFLNQQVAATDNIDDICNAFSDGTTINFFKADNNCENTGRISDVVFHEYGHSIHFHAIIEGVGAFEDALSEGQADYNAATFTGDPAMGRGFFYDESELRHLDPPNKENHWPEDVVGEPHEDGIIIGQALWDLRKGLVEKIGETEGVQKANELYYQAIRRAVDIPSMYVEVLTADDDDGDLTNGTPNVCEIDTAFGLHGLRAFHADTITPSVVPPTQEGYQISLTLNGLYPQCSEDQIASATITFHDRDKPDAAETLPMNASGTTLSAMIPKVQDGTVVRYGVDISFADGGTMHFPDNAADPEYEFYVGDVTPLYCESFDADPFANAGWTHGLASGEMSEGADDWMWGPPNGNASNGDPETAFTGDAVIGNDLSPMGNFNGLYQSDKINWARSPKVDVSAWNHVRLQYRRWLNVEDALYDHGRIYANDQVAWENLATTEGVTQHQDREWRFQDVDLTPYVGPNSTVDVKFEIESDGGLELGGWNIDDVCIVAYDPKSATCDGLGGCGAGGGDTGGSASTGGNLDADPEGGCGCVVAGEDGSETSRYAALFGASLLGALAMVRRRRRAR